MVYFLEDGEILFLSKQDFLWRHVDSLFVFCCFFGVFVFVVVLFVFLYLIFLAVFLVWKPAEIFTTTTKELFLVEVLDTTQNQWLRLFLPNFSMNCILVAFIFVV